MNDFEKMPILNYSAAGIDVGSKNHFVAIGQEEGDVKEFGVYSKNHEDIIKYLKESITSKQ